MKIDITPRVLKDKLRRVLAERRRVSIAPSGRVAAAVLLPLYYKEGEYYILFVQRSQGVSRHKGQIAFPGGVCEEADSCRRETACRECREEIGILPRDVDVLGELDDVFTRSTGYLITPFVGFLSWPCSFRLDTREIAAVIEVPLAALLDAGQTEQRQEDGETITYRYQYGETVIWGATARILHQFLDILKPIISKDS